MSAVLAYFFSGPELIIVGLIALALFGGRLPSAMRSLGQSVTSFKSGLREEDGSKPPEAIDAEKKSAE